MNPPARRPDDDEPTPTRSSEILVDPDPIIEDDDFGDRSRARPTAQSTS
jgi:hypothetical protein